MPIADPGDLPLLQGFAMKASALKTTVVAALCAVGCVSFAQTSSDTNSGSLSNNSSSYPQDVNATSSGMNGANTSGTGSARAANEMPGYRSCSGLSDRQTERACRQGFPTQHSNQPFATNPREGGGQTDDQAG
jgi:hypothetical protein